MLPNISDCEFFKRTTLLDGSKMGRAFIFKLKSDGDYSFVFDCPHCGDKNEFGGPLVLKEVKNGREKRKYIAFNCRGCSTEFMVEKFKVRKMGAGKKEGA